MCSGSVGYPGLLPSLARVATSSEREDTDMIKLLSAILEAHGGIDRWNGFNQLEATIVTDGHFWPMKSVAQDQDPRRFTARLHEQRASLAPFGDPDWHLDFVPQHVAIMKSDGTPVIDADNPRASFSGHGMRTPWDPLRRAYFSGYALWTYLCTPFLLAHEGVDVTEIEPWTEADQTWRVLRARFPDSIATHSAVQDFFFGDDFLLRRHDYNVDVAGGFDASQLVFDYIAADGIRLPSRRRAYTRDADRNAVLDPLMVSIDISEVSFS